MIFHTLEEVKQLYISFILKFHGGNKMRTARTLGISVRGLRNYVKKYNLWLTTDNSQSKR